MRFSVGQIVYLKADPSRLGPVIEVLPPLAERFRYRVFHSPGEIREYSEEQLLPIQTGPTAKTESAMPLLDSPVNADEFLARLTACRLANPLTDNLYALHAARIKFIPFQFKPLLRLLRSDRPRLLIADEVGVGKTIEPSADPDALDVLLSSEVGCEGLDYEFCDCLVNYDIPWNPMRLEQRIGRIDRFGQQSEKVLIFNFVTPGTVEERIFFRCFDRLGIFRDTIGDCEEVLGEQAVMEQLLEVARNPRLTPEQADEKARQIADNAVRLVEEQHRLEAEGGSLLGLDQSLTDEVADIDAEGRFVSPDELRTLIGFFVGQPECGGKLEPDKQAPGLFRLRLNQQARVSLANQLHNWQPADRSLTEFRRWLDGSEPHLAVTFSQQIALERRDLPFITPVHPLARLATEHLKQRAQPLAAHLSVQIADIRTGTYVFVCELWETIAIRPEIRLVSFAWSSSDRRLAPDVSGRLLGLLKQAQSADIPVSLSANDADEAIAALDAEIHRQRDTVLAELLTRNEQLVAQKLASLEAYQQNRLARIERELSTASDDRIIRMKNSEKTRADRDYAARRQEIESRRNADIVRERVALGILEAPAQPTAVEQLAQQEGVSLEDVREFKANKDVFKQWQSARKPKQPEAEPRNAAQREERVTEQARNAAPVERQIRERTVRPNWNTKEEARTTLRELNTNDAGQMVCQVCREEMPFKLDDGSYYFEAIECVKGLNRELLQNYIALCPVCAAKFRHANGTPAIELKQRVLTASGPKIPVILACEEREIVFTKTHLLDVRAALGTVEDL